MQIINDVIIKFCKLFVHSNLSRSRSPKFSNPLITDYLTYASFIILIETKNSKEVDSIKLQKHPMCAIQLEGCRTKTRYAIQFSKSFIYQPWVREEGQSQEEWRCRGIFFFPLCLRSLTFHWFRFAICSKARTLIFLFDLEKLIKSIILY